MKISLITISAEGLEWKTMRDGVIAGGQIGPDVPQDENGDFLYTGPQFRFKAATHGRPFSDLPVFFDATPKLDKFFRSLAAREFSPKWFGVFGGKPTIAVHLVGYSRLLHLGEKLALKDCILRWGGRNAVVCNWPTRYTDFQIREILAGDALNKRPNPSLQPTPPGRHG